MLIGLCPTPRALRGGNYKGVTSRYRRWPQMKYPAHKSVTTQRADLCAHCHSVNYSF